MWEEGLWGAEWLPPLYLILLEACASLDVVCL